MPDSARRPSRVAAVLARWRRIEPRVGVVVVLAGLATGLWLGADGDAGVRAVARALRPPTAPTTAQVELLRRADGIAVHGEGTVAERATAAAEILSALSDLTGAEGIAAETRDLRLAALAWLAGDAARAAPVASKAPRAFRWVRRGRNGAYRMFQEPGDLAETLDTLVELAPSGLFDRSHPCRALATLYAAVLAESRGIGPACRALCRAGLSPAEAFVAAHATSRLGEPRSGCDPDWFRTEWRGIADELCAIANDGSRAAGDRHAAVDALAWIADLPPALQTPPSVPVDARAEHALRTWERLRELDFVAGAHERVRAALKHAGAELDGRAANPTASAWWLQVRLGVPMNGIHDLGELRALLDATRAGELQRVLAAELGLPPDPPIDALLAAVFETRDRMPAQWLLAMRLAAAGGVAPSTAPEASRDHAAWCGALGLPPIGVRVTVDRFEVTADGLTVRSETRVVPAEPADPEAEPWPGAHVHYVIDTAPHDAIAVPGVRGEARVWSRLPQWQEQVWFDMEWDTLGFRDPVSGLPSIFAPHHVVGDGGGARVAFAASSGTVCEQDALRWCGVFAESADGTAPAASWDARLARALRQCRDDWTREGFERSPPTWTLRLEAVAAAVAAAPALAARDDIAALLEVRHLTWSDDVLRNLVSGLALAGDHDLLLRPSERADADVGGRELVAALPASVPPSGWLALLAETEDPALRELAISVLCSGKPDPEVARALLEILERQGIELAPRRREMLAACAKRAPPRDVVELVANHVELSYASIGAIQAALVALLVALVGRRRRRTRGGGMRCAAWTVVLGLAFVMWDSSVGPLDVVPDWLGYAIAAFGCLELSHSASSRSGRFAAAVFALAAIGDVVDQATLSRLGITPVAELVAMIGVVALAGLGRDVVRATTPPVDAPPRRPLRIRPVVWLTPFLGALLAFVATAKIREELSFDLALEDVAYLVAVMVLGVGAVLALGRRHAAPSADAALSPLPLPFVLAYALPVALLSGYALTTDTGIAIPRVLHLQDVSLLTMISTSLAVVWVLLRLIDAAGIATSRRAGAAGTGGGPGNSPAG